MKKLFPLLLMSILIFSCGKSTDTSGKTSKNSSKKTLDKSLVAMAMKDGIYGYITPTGDYIIEPQYPLARSFSNGVACVNIDGVRNNFIGGVLGGTYTFIDLDGKIKKEAAFDEAVSFFNDYAIIRSANGKKGFIDKNINLIADDFDALMPFREGLAVGIRRSENIIGFIDTTGQWKITFDLASYQRMGEFFEGYAFFKKDDKCGYIDKQGKVVIEPKYDIISNLSEGLGAFSLDEKWGFLNKKGEIAINNEYKDVSDFSDGLSAVLKDEKWGFINRKGEVVIPFQFDAVRSFSEGLAAISQEDKVGYIDKKGNWVIAPQFKNALSFKNGYAIVEQNNKLGFINKKGAFVVEPAYDRVDNFVKPNASNANVAL